MGDDLADADGYAGEIFGEMTPDELKRHLDGEMSSDELDLVLKRIEGSDEEDTPKPKIPLRIGDVLYGFCAGYFGSNSYEDKRVEAIGSDWVIARDEDGLVHMADDIRPDDLCKFKNSELSQYE